jgi:hypothetical protein
MFATIPRSAALAVALSATALAFPARARADEGPAGPTPEHGKAATCDASPVEPGAVEVEVSYAPSWNQRAEPGHAHALTAAVTFGLAPDVDVRVAGGAAAVYDEAYRRADGSAPREGAGLTDLALGARWRFAAIPESSVELALTAGVVAPAGAGETRDRIGLSQGYWSARAALVATKDVGAVTANAEVALTAPVAGDAGALVGIAQLGAGAGWQVARWLQPEIELGWQASVGTGAQVLTATAGVVAPLASGARVVAALQQAVWGRHLVQTTAAIVALKTAL